MIRKTLSGAAVGLGRTLSRSRGRGFSDKLERWTGAFHRALNNVNFDMETNGEARVLKLMALLQPKCIFDVGANVGEWSQLAASVFPSAKIHAFEVVPATFSKLVTNTAHLTNIVPNSFGLSNVAGSLTIHMSGHATDDATAFKIEGMQFHDQHYVTEVEGRVRKGVDYLSNCGIPNVDFLKIDVEGMDLRVIKGFERSLSKVRALQFEYGVFNISSHDLLADFCHHLNERGFIVGKIFPAAVTFFDYRFEMENFHGSNYIAVRSDETALIRALERSSI